MQVTAYIRSLKDIENDRHVLGEATILEKVGDNLYLAEYNGVRWHGDLQFLHWALLRR